MTTALVTRFVSSLLLALFYFIPGSSYSQVKGCKDPYATNYNPSATVNDGKCTYDIINYMPPIKVNKLDDILKESSGLQMAGDYLWSFNDGNNAAAIYRVDTVTGAVLQTVHLGGATNVDWEDMAFDGTYFYIGDMGNNSDGARTDLKIYKFRFSDIPADYVNNKTVTVPANRIDIINYKYSDQNSFVPTKDPNTTSFDCEAMIVDGGKIHLFTKDWIGNTTTHYVINSMDAGTYEAMPVETLAAGFLVTGADKAPGKNIVALIGYQYSAPGNHFMYLLSDYSGGYYFNGNKPKLSLGSAIDIFNSSKSMGQAEGIAFVTDTYGYISNEQFTYSVFTIDQKLRSFNTGNFIPAYVLPLELKNFNVAEQNGRHKISWSFAAPVKNLKVQGSSDGIAFADLQTYSTSASDVYYYTATAARCYRLAWQKSNGAYIYSNIICLKNNGKNTISNILVTTSGQLSFTVNGNTSVQYAFRLLTTDGQLLAQIQQQSYTPGAYSISLNKDLPANSYVFLVMYNSAGRKSSKLWIGK